MTPLDVERSVLARVSEAHTGGLTTFGSPDDFDVQNDEITDWIEAHVDVFDPPAQRKVSPTMFTIRVVVKCFSRSQSNFQSSKATASALFGALKFNEIHVTDEDDNEIGHVGLGVPRIEDTREKIQNGYQLSILTVEGIAQGTTDGV